MTNAEKKRSIITTLLLWLCSSLFFVGVVLMGLASYLSSIPLERDLQDRLEDACGRLAVSLREAVWNIDDQAIERYFSSLPSELHDYVSVRVLTEFDEVIFERRFSEESDVLTRRDAVLHDGKLIGYVELTMSRGRSRAIRAGMTRVGAMITAFGIIVILLVTITLMQIILARPLRRVVSGLRHVAAGEYGYRLPDGRSAEIQVISSEINTMSARIALRAQQLQAEIVERKRAQQELQQLTGQLEETVAARTRSLQEAFDRLKREEHERRQVQDEILAVSGREQQRIGRDLHDSLGQQMAGISLMTAAVSRDLRSRNCPEAELVENVTRHLKDAVAQVRQIAYGLTPVDMAEGKLDLALDRLTAGVQDTFGVKCHYNCDRDSYLTYSINVATHLYRICQEAIHNARYHGHAKEITVSLWMNGTAGEMTIADDGQGMPESPVMGGMGLRIMHFRAESVGGKVSFESNANGGTTVRVTFQDAHVRSEL